MNLAQKVIVITGASDGIGKQIALRLAKEGVKLALIARDKKRLDEVSLQAKKNGAVDVKIYPCDICKTDALEKTTQMVISDFDGIDVLINNAGIWQKLDSLENIERDVIDEVISTNLTSLIHTTRFFLPTLKSRKESIILNVVSQSGFKAQEGQAVYTASKFGVRGFTEVLKVDLKETSVRVASLCQAGINTKMFEKTGEDFPTEKFTNPADLADVVVYILSLPEKIWIHEVCVQY